MRCAENKQWSRRLVGTLLLCMFFVNGVTGAFEYTVHGSRYLGAGSTGLASPLTVFATLNNPAKLAQGRHFQADVHYRSFYGLKNLALTGADVHGWFHDIPLGMAVSRFGNQKYQETEVHAAVAGKFFNALFALKIKWYNLEISHYGAAYTFAIDLAGMYRISESLNLAYYIHNLNEPVLGACRENIPGAFILALDYTPADATRIRCDIITTGEEDFAYHFGVEYKLVSTMYILAGFRDDSGTLAGGIVFEKNKIQICCAYEHHPFLGGSNSVSMTYGL